MHPDILEILNMLVHKASLEIAPSAVNRSNANLFRRFLRSCNFPSGRQILWVHVVDEVKSYHERGDFSSLNTAYILAVWRMVVQMATFGIRQEQILIITFYAAFSKRIRKGIKVATVIESKRLFP